MLNISILGPQASGKGTQARILKDKFNLFYVEMGALLREFAKENSDLGKEVDEIVNQKGKLVSDNVIKLVLEKKLASAKNDQGIIFDGFPRITSQIKDLDQILSQFKRKFNFVLFINLPDELVYKRISGRRICSKCGMIYNTANLSEEDRQKCKSCGGKLIIREDDQKKKIEKRLEVFKKETLPVIEFFREKEMLKEVDGTKSVEEVAKDIEEIICEMSEKK
ncbi:adenylate kinase family protein [Patescibacteria group bacterium]